MRDRAPFVLQSCRTAKCFSQVPKNPPLPSGRQNVLGGKTRTRVITLENDLFMGEIHGRTGLTLLVADSRRFKITSARNFNRRFHGRIRVGLAAVRGDRQGGDDRCCVGYTASTR